MVISYFSMNCNQCLTSEHHFGNPCNGFHIYAQKNQCLTSEHHHEESYLASCYLHIISCSKELIIDYICCCCLAS